MTSPAIEQFVMPNGFTVEESDNSGRYAKLAVEPLERGYGHTLGNALRRILLSSMGGTAVRSIQIDGVPHEFTSIPNVREDATEIVLNFKKLKLHCEGELPRTLELRAAKAGPVTANCIKEDGVTSVLNPDLTLCSLDKDEDLRIEIEIDHGVGYRPAEDNKEEEQPIGIIPVDCLFNPVRRVTYEIEQCRVGQRTDYDRLLLEVWTDERMYPQEAVQAGAEIMLHHASRLAAPEKQEEAGESESDVSERGAADWSSEDAELLDKLCQDIDDLDLSVRAKNCLRNSEVYTIYDLIQKSENELLKFRNFGKKSLKEIKEQLEAMEVALQMEIPEHVREKAEEKRNSVAKSRE